MPFELFVNGGLMRGLPDHKNLLDSTFLREDRTAPRYRIHSIDDGHPGMYEVEEGGISVPGEVYLVTDESWPAIEASEPPNLYRGTISLADGRQIHGILYPRELAEGNQRDISDFGGWRGYLAARAIDGGR